MTTDDLDQLIPQEEQKDMAINAIFLNEVMQTSRGAAMCGCTGHRTALDSSLNQARSLGISDTDIRQAYEQGRKEAQSG